MADDDLRIFISWSGDLAREITMVLHDWLPKMLDRVKPWMSAKDIPAGARGLSMIEEQLDASSFGIIVVTTANKDKPWLNFEAGALSKRFGSSTIRVVPLLVDVDSVYEIDGPISQFQAVQLDKKGLTDLLVAITATVGAEWNTVKTRFDWSEADLWWDIVKARNKAGQQPEAAPVTLEKLLQRLLNEMEASKKPLRQTVRYVRTPQGQTLASGVKMYNLPTDGITLDMASVLYDPENEAFQQAVTRQVEQIATVEHITAQADDDGRMILHIRLGSGAKPSQVHEVRSMLEQSFSEPRNFDFAVHSRNNI
ncbi:toll/interleukin-1 receptor domain-containing protein [Rhodococcoides yunnanense]|uniref:Toll/interleukin-1 receptor domain-containing protein n=1 Tax=Rhodococcoides yunnanense TaxID=278209 RepID=A0ABU4BDA5_9NOCA|nr:toll/interleukin-1 receptor domain-containing protein [Rhodococcus yunnanensis]MDV6262182.1 toll/interleukin-1 receptor domain-containing protein [Rhodococcus yunnanensis]